MTTFIGEYRRDVQTADQQPTIKGFHDPAQEGGIVLEADGSVRVDRPTVVKGVPQADPYDLMANITPLNSHTPVGDLAAVAAKPGAYKINIGGVIVPCDVAARMGLIQFGGGTVRPVPGGIKALFTGSPSGQPPEPPQQPRPLDIRSGAVLAIAKLAAHHGLDEHATIASAIMDPDRTAKRLASAAGLEPAEVVDVIRGVGEQARRDMHEFADRVLGEGQGDLFLKWIDKNLSAWGKQQAYLTLLTGSFVNIRQLFVSFRSNDRY